MQVVVSAETSGIIYQNMYRTSSNSVCKKLTTSPALEKNCICHTHMYAQLYAMDDTANKFQIALLNHGHAHLHKNAPKLPYMVNNFSGDFYACDLSL